VALKQMREWGLDERKEERASGVVISWRAAMVLLCYCFVFVAVSVSADAK